MTDEIQVFSPDVNGLFNALTRMGERVAALEARASAEIGALKKDTESIRQNTHGLRNDLQQIVAVVVAEQTMMKEHMKVCDDRGRRLEKIGFGIASIVALTLGFLLKNHFFPG